jgi:lactate dehydrogenase-like 2-hydroxyacid dehydrogenase
MSEAQRMKIVLTTPWTEEAMAALSEDYEVAMFEGDLRGDAFLAALADADALCPVFYDAIDRSLIERLPERIKLIAAFGVGIDRIDIAAAREARIAVSNTPDVVSEATADLTIGLMIAALRGFSPGERRLREGRWQGPDVKDFLWHTVSGKTLGIIGLGRIGEAVARRAKAFGMRLLYHSRSRKPGAEADLGLEYHEQLLPLLNESDVVSLHVPLSSETRHIINAEALSHMKPSAVLVNTGRGPLVDEAALAAALMDARLFAAGLDVYEDEPAVHPDLLKCPNATLLPHMGTATEETRTAMGMRVKANLDAFFLNGEVLDPVEG